MRETIMNVLEVIPATIANGQALTTALNLGGLHLFGIVVPAAWTAASLTFQMSHDGGATWLNVYDASGSEVTATAGASRYIALDAVVFAPLTLIKVRSGTSGSPVNQGQDTDLQLLLRSI